MNNDVLNIIFLYTNDYETLCNIFLTNKQFHRIMNNLVKTSKKNYVFDIATKPTIFTDTIPLNLPKRPVLGTPYKFEYNYKGETKKLLETLINHGFTQFNLLPTGTPHGTVARTLHKTHIETVQCHLGTIISWTLKIPHQFYAQLNRDVIRKWPNEVPNSYFYRKNTKVLFHVDFYPILVAQQYNQNGQILIRLTNRYMIDFRLPTSPKYEPNTMLYKGFLAEIRRNYYFLNSWIPS